MNRCQQQETSADEPRGKFVIAVHLFIEIDYLCNKSTPTSRLCCTEKPYTDLRQTLNYFTPEVLSFQLFRQLDSNEAL